jgi:phosphatidylglycerol---prolipoprotein diacylglyceryl transferase
MSTSSGHLLVPTYPHAYEVAVVAAVVLGVVTAFMVTPPPGASRERLALTAAVLGVTMLVGAKAYYLVERLAGGWPAVATWRGGYRQPGALLGVLALPLVVRFVVPAPGLGRVADTLVMPAAVGLAVFRLGCLFRGCCYGVVSNLPWAVRFPPDTPAWYYQETSRIIMGYEASTLPVHPLQTYFAVWALLSGTVALGFARFRWAVRGQAFLLFVALHEAGKFALECLRPPPLIGLDSVRWGHGVIFLGATAGFLWVANRSQGGRRGSSSRGGVENLRVVR